jgi:hypothetical protein
MPSQKLLVNEFDLSTLGFWVEAPDGWGSGPGRQDTLLDVQGAGQVLLPDAEQIGPRRWTVEGVLIASSQAEARDFWDAAKQVLQDSVLEVMILPWADRLCVCRMQEMRWTQGRIEDKGLRFALTFLAPSAYLVAPIVDSYGVLNGGEVVVTLGTAPSPFVVQFIGAASAPTLTYYDASGIAQGTVKLSGDLVAREWLHFDSQTLLMVRTSPTLGAVDGADMLSSASRLFQLNPNDGVPGRGPSLALSGGSGSAVVYARKAYL